MRKRSDSLKKNRTKLKLHLSCGAGGPSEEVGQNPSQTLIQTGILSQTKPAGASRLPSRCPSPSFPIRIPSLNLSLMRFSAPFHTKEGKRKRKNVCVITV